MSRRQIAQELECNFNTSGDTVIHPDDLKRMLESTYEPRHKTGFDRNFWIWEEHKPENSYLMVADVARGDGKDFSVFHIIKLETMEVVAEYQGKLSPDVFANMLNEVGREYGNCLLVVENNSIGHTVLTKLSEMNYENIYHSIKSTHEYIDQYQAENMNSAVAGFTNSSKTRPLIVAKLEEFIRNKLITVYSSRLANELKTFIWYNGKPQAMRSYNDDLVMALAIGCWIRDTALQINQRDLEYNRAFLGSMIYTNKSFDTTIPGMNNYNHDNALKNKATDSTEQYKEFLWLLKG
jgi:hypothetical protein